MAYPPFLDLPPARRAEGTVVLPGSKSISNRTLLLAALSAGQTEIRGLLDSDDTRVMRTALEQLGIRMDGTTVHGAGGVFPVKEASLFLGNAGTAFRPLTAALALSGGHYHLSGVARMHERPIADLVDALRMLGCTVHYAGAEGYPPLEILPAGALQLEVPIRVKGDVSSQFLSALLMALPLTGQAADVDVDGPLISQPYVEMTLKMMERFGAKIERAGTTGHRFHFPAGRGYRSPGPIDVEGDASGASYFLAAGAVGGGPVRVQGVGRDSIQGDVHFADVLERMGAHVTRGPDWMDARATGRFCGVDVACGAIPDAAMTLAVCALFAEGPTTLREIGSWRVKETDRIAAMACELRKLGAGAEEGPDWLRIHPRAGGPLAGVEIMTYDDHRIAMCFSLVSLAGVSVRINDPGCVAKTYPDYFDRFRDVVHPAT